jgi:hypothetical protein
VLKDLGSAKSQGERTSVLIVDDCSKYLILSNFRDGPERLLKWPSGLVDSVLTGCPEPREPWKNFTASAAFRPTFSSR